MFQKLSDEIWQSKYQLKDKNGNPIDINRGETFQRVAKALAKNPKEEEEFLWALHNGAIPAGRVLSNAGAGEHKSETSLINCTVSETIQDSIEGIMRACTNSAITLSAGCGIGYDFSTLRPSGSLVAGVGASTSGPLSFMEIFDKMCGTISSAGGRRGAQMGTFHISHPDTIKFIEAKRQDGMLRKFNLSLLVPDEFMQAVEEDGDWTFYYPVHIKEYELGGDYITRYFPIEEDHHVRDGLGRTYCKKYQTVKARYLYDLIMKSTYDFSEPGVLFIDKINDYNPLGFKELIRSTNPCGEQPLPPEGACLLGSINLTKFVKDPFREDASFDLVKYAKVVRIFTRMLDRVVDISNLPLKGQREEIRMKRRHGMGFTGLGSAMVMMNLPYNTSNSDSFYFIRDVCATLVQEGFLEGIRMAKEEGCAPIFYEENVKEMYANSAYIRSVVAPLIGEEGMEDLRKYGCRFTHHSSIAPTGTISLAMGNNVSNGIEPSYSHSYLRNVIVEGKKTKMQEQVYSYEALLYKEIHGITHEDDGLEFEFADMIDPKDHIDVQALVQEYIDSSISKTINIPTDYPFEDFKELYLYAYNSGLKGCTTFRFNPSVFSGVLVKENDLNNTLYVFNDDQGNTYKAKGTDKVFYDGEEHVASNLYDAIKEGYYGKH